MLFSLFSFLLLTDFWLLLFLFIEAMKKMGYEPRDIEESLKQQKYDDITATYLLLGRKPLSEVNGNCLLSYFPTR